MSFQYSEWVFFISLKIRKRFIFVSLEHWSKSFCNRLLGTHQGKELHIKEDLR